MPVPPINHIEELQREAFNILPGTVNVRRGAVLAHASGISQEFPVAGRSNFENELAEEATWTLHNHPCHVHFASNPQKDLHLPPEDILRKIDQWPGLIMLHIHPDMR